VGRLALRSAKKLPEYPTKCAVGDASGAVTLYYNPASNRTAAEGGTNSGADSVGELSGVRYVQRLNTVGGGAPAQMCTTEHQIAYSPYFANYVFWK